MSEYRRWISYIYAYENGEKKQNVGYARIELRNGRVRFHIRMNMPAREQAMAVCCYKVQGEQCDGVSLGSLPLATGREELRIETDSDNLAGSGLFFVEMSGLLMFEENQADGRYGNYYASSWEEEPLTTENAQRVMQRVRKRMEPEGTRTVGETVPEAAEPADQQATGKSLATGGQMQEEAVKAGNENAQEELSEEREEAAEVANENAQEELSEERAEAVEVANENAQEELSEERAEVAEVANESAQEELSEEKIEAAGGAVSEVNQKVQEKRIEAVELSQPGIRNQCCSAWRENRPFCCLEPMYPFEDGEFERSVRMEPQDIGMLPRSMWKYAGNSFLLHGFYTYHHLLLTRKRGKEGDVCYLLVPGTYSAREQHMAQMFGFRHFKTLKRKNLENGDFGYWYLEVPGEQRQRR